MPLVLRYGLVLVVFWIGCLKFTDYESKGVFNHASHSPLLAWGYHFLDVRNFSRGLGVIEIAIAVVIAAGPVWPKLSIIGSLGGIGMFLTTLSFVITTPGVWQQGYGFPALAGFPGQFLIKDVVLLGAAIWTLADSLTHVGAGGEPRRKRRKFDDWKSLSPLDEDYKVTLWSFYVSRGVTPKKHHKMSRTRNSYHGTRDRKSKRENNAINYSYRWYHIRGAQFHNMGGWSWWWWRVAWRGVQGRRTRCRGSWESRRRGWLWRDARPGPRSEL